MPFLRPVDVDEPFLEDLWKRVSGLGGYYSIGDGASYEVFSKVFYQSALVLQGESIVIRFDRYNGYVEMHPIVWGHSCFRYAEAILEECASFFTGERICCMIPQKAKGLRHLALRAGMVEKEVTMRNLSGVAIPCVVYWRQ